MSSQWKETIDMRLVVFKYLVTCLARCTSQDLDVPPIFCDRINPNETRMIWNVESYVPFFCNALDLIESVSLSSMGHSSKYLTEHTY